MRQIFGGAILVIAGIAAFIEAHSHHKAAYRATEDAFGGATSVEHAAGGLSQTAYDLLRIGAWALVILGALTVIVGLIRYWQGPSRAT